MLPYIVSVAGISVLTVLLDIILPEGNIHKYIKSIFSVLVIIVVISPIVKTLKSDIDFDAIFQQGDQYQVDNNFLLATNAALTEEKKLSVIKFLDGRGYEYAGIDLISDSLDSKKVSYVNIYLYSDSIKEKDKNIYIQEIQEQVSGYLKIEKANVRVILW